MAALRNRIAKLEGRVEAIAKGPARLFAVKSNGASSDEIDAFLATEGYAVDHDWDMVVHLRVLFENRDGTLSTGDKLIELMNFTSRGSR